MKTIQLMLDDELFEQVEQTVAQQKTTLPKFMHEALVHYLHKLRIRELEKHHREGYKKYPVQPGEFDVWEDEQVWSI
jgi:hypothetical protein